MINVKVLIIPVILALILLGCFSVVIASTTTSRNGSCSVPIIYVNINNANGAHDGTSWKKAYTNLQDALTKARSASGAEQIWIAKGTYLPGSTPTDTFNLPNNVKIYGGFLGNES